MKSLSKKEKEALEKSKIPGPIKDGKDNEYFSIADKLAIHLYDRSIIDLNNEETKVVSNILHQM